MQSFRFGDLKPFEGQSVSVKRPREITEFSYDGQHVQHQDGRSLRYYYPPFFDAPHGLKNRTFDLCHGFESFNKFVERQDTRLYPLLDTLIKYEEANKSKLDPTVITWRGMMTKILSAPFDAFGEFNMNATYFDGTIFIEEDFASKHAEESQSRRQQHGAHSQEKMQYWGYKFETLSTLPRPWAECSRDEIEDRDSEIVSNHAQYCSVVHTGLGEHRMVLGGEVDAVQGCKPDDPDQAKPYVELKTSEDFHPNDNRSALKFERKLCRFWAQSFLLGVPQIIIGLRSKDGILQRMMELKTLDIPRLVKQNTKAWDAWICISFADKFLNFLKEHITEDGVCWSISREKGKPEILLQRRDDISSQDIVPPKFRTHRADFKFEKSLFEES